MWSKKINICPKGNTLAVLVTGVFLMLAHANVWGKWIEVIYPATHSVLDWACEDVVWKSSADVQFVVIDYSVNDGKTWARVPKWGSPSGPSWNDGVSYWNPPWIWTKHAKVRVSDSSDPSVYGISDFFTIRDKHKDKSMTMPSPSGGDVYTAGSTIEISWQTSGNIWYLNAIDFSSDGGQNWQKIKGYTFIDDKPFRWRLPSGFQSDKCLIRLSQTDDDFPITVLGGIFTVREKPLNTLFKNTTAQSGIILSGGNRCAAWVDWNRDGREDLFVTAVDGIPNALFLQNENHSFTRTELQGEIADVLMFDRAGLPADVNGDGNLDLFLGGGAGFLDRLLISDGTGWFRDATSKAGITDTPTETNGAAFFDYDLDGDLDLFICRWETENALYRNNGDETFTDVAREAGVAGPLTARTSAVAVGDFNNDGFPDLYVVNSDQASNFLYRNNQNGTFNDVTDEAKVRLDQNNKSAEWGDFNNDGRLDLFVVRRSTENVLFIQNADGQFTYAGRQANVATTGDGFAMTLADFDNDGYLDILTAYNSGSAKLQLNNGDGTFMETGETAGFTSMVSPRGIAACDYDQDGDQDIIITDEDGPGRLYTNQAVNQNVNHWLKINLKGRGGNAEAIGAKVQVLSGGKKQIREVQVGTGYGNRNSTTVHFGLGINRTVDELRVFWPTGSISSYAQLKSDTVYVFEEKGETQPASITLSSPAAGTLIRAGKTAPLQWRTIGSVDSVVLSYSIDRGNQWQTIGKARNTGSFEWTVPVQVFSEEACIRIHDSHQSQTSDTSGLFIIESAAIPLKWAADSDEIKAGETMNVALWLADSLHQVHGLKKTSGLLHFSLPQAVRITPGSFKAGSLWGASPLVVFQSDSTAGELNFEITKTGDGFTGFGKAVEFKVQMTSKAPSGVVLELQPAKLALKHVSGDSIPMTAVSGSVRILDSGIPVWPGDTNNDGKVNQDDVLPIGVYYGTKGSARTGSTTAWNAQNAAAWTSPNAPYADADGNGTIDENDLAAVSQNWGKYRGSFLPTVPSGEVPSSGAVSIKTNAPVGNTAFSAALNLTNVSGISGLSFMLRYYSDKLTVDSANASIFYRNQFVSIFRVDSAARLMYIGLFRKPGVKDETTYTNLFTIWMRLKKNVPNNTPIIFSLDSVTAVNASGQRLLLTAGGGGFLTAVTRETDNGTPAEFRMYPNYPNPFNPSTRIDYDLPADSDVLIKFFSVNGKEITVFERKRQTQGRHAVIWNGEDRSGKQVPSGLYFYQIIAGNFNAIGKCTLIK
jgi:hypothetical protein